MPQRLATIALRRAEWLLFARLALTAVSFAIAIGLERPDGELTETARRGLFWTVALSFGATAISGTLVRRVRRIRRFAWVQIALDATIVSSLVYFSGGHESVFVFLYLVVAVYAAVLFERSGAIGAASISALCFGVVLVAGASATDAPWQSLAGIWVVRAGALYLVGGLAAVLARDLHRAGEALDRSESDLYRLKSLHQRTVESIMSGLITTDSGFRITSFNPEAEQITGIAVSEAIDLDADSVIPGLREIVMRDPAGSPEDGPRARMQYRNRRGEQLHLGLAGSILRDEDGAPIGHVVIFQDVTRVVEMEALLRRSERLAAVGELSAKMAHEIRNPLAAISGSVQVLQSGLPKTQGDSEQHQLMQIVVRETDRLSDLIQDFLHYAQPRPPKLESVPLGPLVQDVLRLFESARPKGVRIEVVGDGTLAVTADPAQLRQIVWNLVLNAAQAVAGPSDDREEGEIRVGFEAIEALDGAAGGALEEAHEHAAQAQQSASRNEDQGWVELSIADTGCGISPEAQEQIFEPFFTTRREGSGLGLSTVHRIVESHGGELQLESQEGEGTTFRVRLPRAAVSAECAIGETDA